MHSYQKPDNLVALIEESVEKYMDSPLFGTKNRQGCYEWARYADVGKRIDNLRGGLAGIGLTQGDGVGFIASNRTEWAVAAFATFGLGGRFIPMYEKELLKIWKYIIKDAGIKVLLVSKPEIAEQIEAFKHEMPGLEHIFILDADGENSLSRLEQKGNLNPVPARRPSPEEVAVLIYTSGTTGNPKGVLLTHGNFTSNFLAGASLFPNLKGARSISILPWAHSFGQTGELYNFIYNGGSMGFVESPETVSEDMGKIQPTFLIAVPRVFNKIYDRLWAKMNDTGGLAKMLFLMGIESAKKRRNGKADFLTNLKLRIADAIVFKKIRARFGGKLECAISGSATMNVEISHFFADIGIPVYDCYGLTETSPAVTMNCKAAYKPGSVGKPIRDVRVVIDTSFSAEGSDEGEIVVYGPNVMLGYHNNPNATRTVMTDDGGLRTGDQGRLDEDGFLFITGRIKEQYKLENGKYVFPASVEEEIKLIPWVANALIYGDGKPFNICILVPDFAVLDTYAREKGLPTQPEHMIREKAVTDMIAQTIADRLENKFRGYEIPRKFLWLTEDFSLDNGSLTQTMKLKRRVVLERYGEEIEALYRENTFS